MKKSNLPRSNATYHRPGSTGKMDESSLKGMICNPVYTGIASFPQLISDEAWIKAATQFITEEGSEQFLVNMLAMLRQTLTDAGDPAQISATTSPAVAILAYCSHDDFPMIRLNRELVCIGEYLFTHLENTTVRDIITEPVLTLVFHNGHTLPLLCPDCGESLHISDEDVLLNTLNGLALVDLDWDEDTQAVVLYFGEFPEYIEEGLEPVEIEAMETLEIHLAAVLGLTCPHHGNA